MVSFQSLLSALPRRQMPSSCLVQMLSQLPARIADSVQCGLYHSGSQEGDPTRHKARTTKRLPGGIALKCKSEQSTTRQTALPWLSIAALQETFPKAEPGPEGPSPRGLFCSHSLCLSAPLLPTTVHLPDTEAPQRNKLFQTHCLESYLPLVSLANSSASFKTLVSPSCSVKTPEPNRAQS